MASTGYNNLKYHFDRLITAPIPANSVGDPIRDVYKKVFNQKVGLYDVFRTEIAVPTNPIRYAVSLLNTKEPNDDIELMSGIMFSNYDIVHTSIFEKEVRGGIFESDAAGYINKVYGIMDDIISMDMMYKSDKYARSNPYLVYIKVLPFYLTFNHVKDCLPALMKEDVFKSILEKYIIADPESINKVMTSINRSRYSSDIEQIYTIMTCNNTVKLFD